MRVGKIKNTPEVIEVKNNLVAPRVTEKETKQDANPLPVSTIQPCLEAASPIDAVPVEGGAVLRRWKGGNVSAPSFGKAKA